MELHGLQVNIGSASRGKIARRPKKCRGKPIRKPKK